MNNLKSIISLTNIRRFYNTGQSSIHAINDISLDFYENEFVAIVGKSGSGKTTLMNIIGGLDVASEGHVHIHNKDTTSLNSRALARFRNETIGFIFQQFNLLNEHTALSNVMLPLEYRRPKAKKIKEKAEQALERVGLGSRMLHKPQELSGGQQQRVAIARALVGQPKILLADEPTGALDSKTSEDLLMLFEELKTDGLTILLITHDLDVASHAQRIIKLHDGLVIEDKRLKS